MRLIDKIWNELGSPDNYDMYLDGGVTHIYLPKHSMDTLLADYREEFDDHNAGLDDLQEYFGMRIVVGVSSVWRDDKEFELLKKA